MHNPNDLPRRIGPDDLSQGKIANSAAANPMLKIPAGVSALSSSLRPGSCPSCDGLGWYGLAVPYGHPQFGKPQCCDCAAYRAQVAPRAARLHDELGSLADKTFDSFRLDRALAPFSWQGAPMSIAAQQQFMASAKKRCAAWVQSPRGWLFIHGGYGAGKSHLAAAMANAYRGAIVRFVTINKMLDVLRAGIDDGSTDRLLADLLGCDLLILDELAAAQLAECVGDWRFGRIERLINERLEKPTVITSNLAPDDLAAPGDVRAERLADRIAGVSQIVWMPIASYRRIEQVAM